MSKEMLKKVSIEVLNAMVDYYIRTYSLFEPIIVENNEHKKVLKDKNNKFICFTRPELENWNIYDGLGKVLKDLIDDPGMHNTAMKHYGKKEIAELYNMKLIDVSGNPTELGEKVYKAMVN